MPRPPAIAEFAAEPGTVQRGQPATLRWRVSEASEVSIDPGVGAVPAAGSRRVAPSDTTTYTLSARGPGGSISERATVTVAVPPPKPPPAITEFAAEPGTVQRGQPATLRWRASEASEVSIDPGIGVVPAAGSRRVSPTDTTTYTLSARGPGGSISERTTVMVTVPPKPPAIAEFVAEPTTVQRGQPATLRWRVSEATEVSIDPGIGAVPAAGGRKVSPTGTTTYTLSARGPGGSVSERATLTVTLPVPTAGDVQPNARDGLRYVWIPPGSFRMGCSTGDNQCYSAENPGHAVTITRGYWIGQTEVTLGAYRRFMQATGRSAPPAPSFAQDESHPVVNVTWDDAAAYCQWAGGRLPTEAEWEYAARAGTTSVYYGELGAIAWYVANSGPRTHPVGQKQPNAWRLYDMLGNVREWVADWYGEKYYASADSRDPHGPPSGEFRGLRGGSWFSNSRNARVSDRGGYRPGNGLDVLGFRCARE